MKNNKKDIFYLLTIVLSFIILIIFLTHKTKLFGSAGDWYAQHISFPEYFRSLFYSTKDLLPDFAANIGNGQNIYNFSYYGLLNPIILISYLFPKVSMLKYIITSTVIITLLATILLYAFLRKKDYSSEICFVSSFIFIMSASISLHTHRHIMFINYMPFLIMGLFGVEKKFATNKGWLLSLSTFLMIMTSYYYSVDGLICLTLYAVYLYLKKTNKVTLKTFIKEGFNFLLPVIVGILSASIITIPTLATIFNSRAATNITISLKDILLPRFNTKAILYSSYGLGLTAIAIPSLLHFFKGKKDNIFLAISLLLLIILPSISYFLNGFMYIDSKILIPFLPLYILTIANFIKDVLDKKINYKLLIIALFFLTLFIALNKYKFILYLADILFLFICLFTYNKTNKKYLFLILLLIVPVVSCYLINTNDYYELKYETEDTEEKVTMLLNKITDNDQSFYRISNDISISKTPNKRYENINYYGSTVYSSTSNQNYNKFYFDTINNNISSRNRAITSASPNIINLLLNSNKYIISKNKGLQGYEKIYHNKDIYVYKNEDVLPLGFATNNIMSYDDFNRLSNQVKQEALLDVLIVDEKSNNNFVSSIQKIEIDESKVFQGNNIKRENDGSYTIDTKEKLTLNYKLDKKYKNKIIFIRFKVNNKQTCKTGDQLITINNVRNKKTCSSWKYYNQNEIFDYVVAQKDLEELFVTIYKGKYNISNLELYYLDYAAIEKTKDNFDLFEVDNKKTKGDIINGSITAKEDEYFMATIPYDKGFIIKVDNKITEYEKIDEAFIGFKISKGKHNITIEYQSPLKKVAILISLVGLISFIIITILENKRKI